MKSILVPVEDHDWMSEMLETALLLARQFDSYIEGIALGPDLAEIVAADFSMSGVIWRVMRFAGYQSSSSKTIPNSPFDNSKQRFIFAPWCFLGFSWKYLTLGSAGRRSWIGSTPSSNMIHSRFA